MCICVTTCPLETSICSVQPDLMSPTRPAPSPVESGARIVAEMRPSLVRYFHRRTGSHTEAEDLAQDVIVSALAHANWTSPAQAKGYLFRAAVNRWRDMRRRLRTRGVPVAWDDELTAELSAHGSPERVFMGRDELSRLLRALEEMNPRTRSVLLLIRLEQLKIATVADQLGISVSAVNKHLARGLAALARFRQEEDQA